MDDIKPVMKDIIKTKHELCMGCNRCVRECPMEMANITYQDEDGNLKVKIDHTKCIVCGRCVSVCNHNARYYDDDTELFFNDLSAGIPISLIAAPSVRTNIPHYKRLFTYLRKIGVKKIYDVSLGADICIWAHIRHIEQNGCKPIITQPCPAIVSYCEIYRHDLLKRLSVVHSPMACTAIYMREHEGIHDRIAAISPCIAKSTEFEETKAVHYNVTFAKLLRYIKENNIVLPNEETGFDHYESGLGSLFPMPGGLKENIEYYFGKPIRIDRSEGKSVYQKLNVYEETADALLPGIFDVLNCEEGCNEGTGCTRETNFFEIGRAMENSKKAAAENRGMEYFKSLYKTYDDTLRLQDYTRRYIPYDMRISQITEADIEEAFKALDKNDDEKKHFNCGACGSETCYNMARKIALKVNIPENCMIKARESARIEHEKNLLAYQESVRQNIMIKDTLERFETIWENVESGIIMVDAETRVILDANPVAIRMFGKVKADIVGKKCHNFICPEETDACPIMDKNQAIDRQERKFINSKGEIIPIIKSVTKIRYNDRLVLLENFTDISYLKEAEEHLRLLHITEQANQAKSDFLSRMSHEIRTPMNAIIGMAQIAENSTDVNKLNYCLSMIGSSSAHLLGLINDVLDMSKIEAGKLELENAPLNIEKILMKVSNLVIEKIEQKNIRFNIIMGNNMRLNYIGDELRLSQVITNFISNAVKFTQDEGRIRLSAEEIQVQTGYSVIRFAVADNGIGMTEEQKSRLFNAFQQADSSITRKFGGTGLGLTISKSIIEKMNGKIMVESEPGKGSAFSFDVRLEHPVQQDEQNVSVNIRLKDINALFVDNDWETREYFKSITAGWGVHTEEAENEEKALSLVQSAESEQKPKNIIFIDYNSPDTDGLEIAKKIKNKTNEKTEIIIMTSFFKWDKIENEARGIGIRRFISKPLFPSLILNVLNDVIGTTAQNNETETGEADKKPPDFSNISLLFAEDVEINREIFMTLLEETKINIDVAENGQIAVRKFMANPEKYDLIIMDLQMPIMSGIEATLAIRSQDIEKAKKIPIIAMSANAFKEDIDNCIKCGMNDHLAKPIDIQAVIEKIAQYCGYSQGGEMSANTSPQLLTG